MRQFFANGGTQAIVVRVADGYASAAWALDDDTPAAVLAITAASPGAWGNDLRISVDLADARNPDAEFNLVVQQLQADGVTLLPVETHRNLSLNAQSPQYVEAVVNHASALIRARRQPGLVFGEAGFAVSAQVTFPLAATDLVLAGIVDGTTPFRFTLPAALADIGALVAAVDTAIGAAGLAAVLDAAESGVDGGAGTGHLKLASKVAGEKSAVVISGGAFGGLANVIHLGLANGGRAFTGDTEHRPAAVADVAPAVKGIDGTPGTATQIVGSQSAKSGIYALLDVDLFNILSIPETFSMADGDAAAVIPAAVDLCERRRAFYLVEPAAS